MTILRACNQICSLFLGGHRPIANHVHYAIHCESHTLHNIQSHAFKMLRNVGVQRGHINYNNKFTLPLGVSILQRVSEQLKPEHPRAAIQPERWRAASSRYGSCAARSCDLKTSVLQTVKITGIWSAEPGCTRNNTSKETPARFPAPNRIIKDG